MNLNILLRAIYDENFPKLDKFIITIKDRFSPSKEKKIKCSLIKEVKKNYIILKTETIIPSHRIIKIEKIKN